MEHFSAASVKFPFWFKEFTQIMEWYVEDDNWEDINTRIIDERYFKFSSRPRTVSFCSEMTHRITSLSAQTCDIFYSVDTDNQKLINLMSIMNINLLVRTFMIEEFRQELLLGDAKIEDFELQAFFRNLQATHEETAQWTDETVNRLKGTLKNYLVESGLATFIGNDIQIIRPLLDPRLEAAIEGSNHPEYLAVFNGR